MSRRVDRNGRDHFNIAFLKEQDKLRKEKEIQLQKMLALKLSQQNKKYENNDNLPKKDFQEVSGLTGHRIETFGIDLKQDIRDIRGTKISEDQFSMFTPPSVMQNKQIQYESQRPNLTNQHPQAYEFQSHQQEIEYDRYNQQPKQSHSQLQQFSSQQPQQNRQPSQSSQQQSYLQQLQKQEQIEHFTSPGKILQQQEDLLTQNKFMDTTVLEHDTTTDQKKSFQRYYEAKEAEEQRQRQVAAADNDLLMKNQFKSTKDLLQDPYSKVDTTKDPYNAAFENTRYNKVTRTPVHIDSEDRNSILYSDPNDFKIFLPRIFRDVKEIKILSLEIPNTDQMVKDDPLAVKQARNQRVYKCGDLLNTANNHLYWIDAEDADYNWNCLIYDAPITPGNYVATECQCNETLIQTEIETQVGKVNVFQKPDPTNPLQNIGGGPHQFIVSINEQTNRVEILSIDSFGLEVDPIITQAGTNIITVKQSSHGFSTGDSVTIIGSTAVGGIPADVINGEHTITVIDANNYEFRVSTIASISQTGGGANVTAGRGRPFMFLFSNVDTIGSLLGFPQQDSSNALARPITFIDTAPPNLGNLSMKIIPGTVPAWIQSDNHDLIVGDDVFIMDTDTIPAINGLYTVTAVVDYLGHDYFEIGAPVKVVNNQTLTTSTRVGKIKQSLDANATIVTNVTMSMQGFFETDIPHGISTGATIYMGNVLNGVLQNEGPDSINLFHTLTNYGNSRQYIVENEILFEGTDYSNAFVVETTSQSIQEISTIIPKNNGRFCPPTFSDPCCAVQLSVLYTGTQVPTCVLFKDFSTTPDINGLVSVDIDALGNCSTIEVHYTPFSQSFTPKVTGKLVAVYAKVGDGVTGIIESVAYMDIFKGNVITMTGNASQVGNIITLANGGPFNQFMVGGTVTFGFNVATSTIASFIDSAHVSTIETQNVPLNEITFNAQILGSSPPTVITNDIGVGTYFCINDAHIQAGNTIIWRISFYNTPAILSCGNYGDMYTGGQADPDLGPSDFDYEFRTYVSPGLFEIDYYSQTTGCFDLKITDTFPGILNVSSQNPSQSFLRSLDCETRCIEYVDLETSGLFTFAIATETIAGDRVYVRRELPPAPNSTTVPYITPDITGILTIDQTPTPLSFDTTTSIVTSSYTPSSAIYLKIKMVITNDVTPTVIQNIYPTSTGYLARDRQTCDPTRTQCYLCPGDIVVIRASELQNGNIDPQISPEPTSIYSNLFGCFVISKNYSGVSAFADDIYDLVLNNPNPSKNLIYPLTDPSTWTNPDTPNFPLGQIARLDTAGGVAGVNGSFNVAVATYSAVTPPTDAGLHCVTTTPHGLATGDVIYILVPPYGLVNGNVVSGFQSTKFHLSSTRANATSIPPVFIYPTSIPPDPTTLHSFLNLGIEYSSTTTYSYGDVILYKDGRHYESLITQLGFEPGDNNFGFIKPSYWCNDQTYDVYPYGDPSTCWYNGITGYKFYKSNVNDKNHPPDLSPNKWQETWMPVQYPIPWDNTINYLKRSIVRYGPISLFTGTTSGSLVFNALSPIQQANKVQLGFTNNSNQISLTAPMPINLTTVTFNAFLEDYPGSAYIRIQDSSVVGGTIQVGMYIDEGINALSGTRIIAKFPSSAGYTRCQLNNALLNPVVHASSTLVMNELFPKPSPSTTIRLTTTALPFYPSGGVVITTNLGGTFVTYTTRTNLPAIPGPRLQGCAGGSGIANAGNQVVQSSLLSFTGKYIQFTNADNQFTLNNSVKTITPGYYFPETIGSPGTLIFGTITDLLAELTPLLSPYDTSFDTSLVLSVTTDNTLLNVTSIDTSFAYRPLKIGQIIPSYAVQNLDPGVIPLDQGDMPMLSCNGMYATAPDDMIRRTRIIGFVSGTYGGPGIYILNIPQKQALGNVTTEQEYIANVGRPTSNSNVNKNPTNPANAGFWSETQIEVAVHPSNLTINTTTGTMTADHDLAALKWTYGDPIFYYKPTKICSGNTNICPDNSQPNITPFIDANVMIPPAAFSTLPSSHHIYYLSLAYVDLPSFWVCSTTGSLASPFREDSNPAAVRSDINDKIFTVVVDGSNSFNIYGIPEKTSTSFSGYGFYYHKICGYQFDDITKFFPNSYCGMIESVNHSVASGEDIYIGKVTVLVDDEFGNSIPDSLNGFLRSDEMRIIDTNFIGLGNIVGNVLGNCMHTILTANVGHNYAGEFVFPINGALEQTPTEISISSQGSIHSTDHGFQGGECVYFMNDTNVNQNTQTPLATNFFTISTTNLTSSSFELINTPLSTIGDIFGNSVNAFNTVAFLTAENPHLFVVPPGTYKYEVTLAGAGGGSTALSSGGYGGLVTTSIDVTPGQLLYINVGGAGENATTTVRGLGGANGGGDGINIAFGGIVGASAGGGGSTDIRTEQGNLLSKLVVSGGGGGAAQMINGLTVRATNGGDGGGITGNSGGSVNVAMTFQGIGGGGATGISGGTSFFPGNSGTFHFGGTANIDTGSLGGGGGGWYGGGSGGGNVLTLATTGNIAGGGGGSAFIAPQFSGSYLPGKGSPPGYDGYAFLKRVNTLLFTQTGIVHTITVPAGISTVNLELNGAGGGNAVMPGKIGYGGKGGKVTCSLSVSYGDVLEILVGNSGVGIIPGFPGGGKGTSKTTPMLTSHGGGGGGYSQIKYNGSIILIAGGGGGGGTGVFISSGGSGSFTNPCTGGDAGIVGTPSTFSSGQLTNTTGGSQTSGGAGLESGQPLQGGNALPLFPATDRGRGGGGGGYFGGGGGFYVSTPPLIPGRFNFEGGGGGSNYININFVSNEASFTGGGAAAGNDGNATVTFVTNSVQEGMGHYVQVPCGDSFNTISVVDRKTNGTFCAANNTNFSITSNTCIMFTDGKFGDSDLGILQDTIANALPFPTPAPVLSPTCFETNIMITPDMISTELQNNKVDAVETSDLRFPNINGLGYIVLPDTNCHKYDIVYIKRDSNGSFSPVVLDAFGDSLLNVGDTIFMISVQPTTPDLNGSHTIRYVDLANSPPQFFELNDVVVTNVGPLPIEPGNIVYFRTPPVGNSTTMGCITINSITDSCPTRILATAHGFGAPGNVINVAILDTDTSPPIDIGNIGIIEGAIVIDEDTIELPKQIFIDGSNVIADLCNITLINRTNLLITQTGTWSKERLSTNCGVPIFTPDPLNNRTIVTTATRKNVKKNIMFPIINTVPSVAGTSIVNVQLNQGFTSLPLSNGQDVVITGQLGGNPYINGPYRAFNISTSSFKIPAGTLLSSVGGNGGFVTFAAPPTINGHGLYTGDLVEFMKVMSHPEINFDSDPNRLVNTYTVTKINDTQFSIPVLLEDVNNRCPGKWCSNLINIDLPDHGMANGDVFFLYGAECMGGLKPSEINTIHGAKRQNIPTIEEKLTKKIAKVIDANVVQFTSNFYGPCKDPIFPIERVLGGGFSICISAHNHNMAEQAAGYKNYGFNSIQTNLECNGSLGHFLNLVNAPYIFLTSDVLQNIQSTGSVDNIFAKIQLSGDPGTVLYNTYVATTKVFEDPIAKLDEIDFQLKYKNGNPFDLRGKNYSLTLEILEYQDRHIQSGVQSRRGVPDKGPVSQQGFVESTISTQNPSQNIVNPQTLLQQTDLTQNINLTNQ